MSDRGQPRDVLDGLDLEGLQNRTTIEHIVVLLLENRSFDNMLGYLSLPADARQWTAARAGLRPQGDTPAGGGVDSSPSAADDVLLLTLSV